jgi:hypothetical protein
VEKGKIIDVETMSRTTQNINVEPETEKDVAQFRLFKPLKILRGYKQNMTQLSNFLISANLSKPNRRTHSS